LRSLAPTPLSSPADGQLAVSMGQHDPAGRRRTVRGLRTAPVAVARHPTRSRRCAHRRPNTRSTTKRTAICQRLVSSHGSRWTMKPPREYRLAGEVGLAAADHCGEPRRLDYSFHR
jgi:hypothetical protein